MNEAHKVLAHPIGWQVLLLLTHGGMSDGVIANHVPVSKPTMPVHFAKLKAANLILSENR